MRLEKLFVCLKLLRALPLRFPTRDKGVGGSNVNLLLSHWQHESVSVKHHAMRRDVTPVTVGVVAHYRVVNVGTVHSQLVSAT